MNLAQKIVVVVASILLVITVIFPPYTIYNDSQHAIASGLGFLFDLPTRGNFAAQIDTHMLLIELGVIAIVSISIYNIFRKI